MHLPRSCGFSIDLLSAFPDNLLAASCMYMCVCASMRVCAADKRGWATLHSTNHVLLELEHVSSTCTSK